MSENIRKVARYVHLAAAVALSVFALYTAVAGVLVDVIQRGVVLLLVLIIVYSRWMEKQRPWYKLVPMIVIMLVSCGTLIFQLANYKNLATNLGTITTTELILCVALVISLWIATRITIGWPIVVISGIFVLYAIFGNSIPGMLSHRGYSISRIIAHLCVGSNGIFGTPLGTAATMVIMFIIFGCFLEASGGAAFFMDMAIALTGRSRGGPAKAAVISSALMGTISGNAASNVVTTGTFTIPLMKRIGYKSEVAGAIEAVASTGGQIMPPVMGAAAFIMAEIMGISYGEIALAAVIPALLYYISVFFMVHFEACKTNVQKMSSEEIPELKKTMSQNWHTLIAIVVLVGALIMGCSTMKSALYGTAAAFCCSFFRRHTRITPKKLFDTLVASADGTVTVAIACACAGIIIGCVSLTGLGLKISSVIISASGGHLLVALVLTLFALIILGMGMPTAAAYIMVATLVAPGLQDMGLAPLAAHMFCLYGAVLSAITPPVALAAYAASGIAKANPMKIGFIACKFGLVAFIVPFFFAYQPALLCIGPLSDVLLACVTSVIGVVALSAALQGYFNRHVSLPLRIIVFAGALLMIYPGLVTDLIGLVMIIAGLLPQFMKKPVTKSINPKG